MDVRVSFEHAGEIGGSAAKLLFERLPDRLFRPLAAENRFQYWTLLCAMHTRRFGPDAPLAPSDGFTHREITRDLEEILYALDWAVDDEEDPSTPLGVRANNLLQQLVDWGWLREDRRGLEKRITMAPTVSQFLSELVRFAETGPVFVAGKIRSIELNVMAVANGAGGDSLAEAAESARNLIEHIRNTGLNVRDVMSALTPDLATGEYVRRFFSDYIESIFIGDYRELRTREHPLARRLQILDVLERVVCAGEIYERLTVWYQKNMAGGDRVRAVRILERNLDRIRELSRIDEYLERLDDEIRRANKQAAAVLDYRVRALRPVDVAVDAAIASILRLDCDVTVPFGSGPMLCSAAMAEPRKRTARAPVDSLRQDTPTEEDIARMRLAMRVREARQMTPAHMALFLVTQLGSRTAIASHELRIERVAELVAKQALVGASLAMTSRSDKLIRDARMLTRSHELQLDTHELEPEDTALRGHVFHIAKRKR